MMQAMAAVSTGTRIRLRRQQLRLTQEELARRLGVDPATIVNWEKDRHFPVRHQGALEAELGISLSDGEDTEIPPDLQRKIDELTPEQQAHVMKRITEHLSRRRGGASGQAPA